MRLKEYIYDLLFLSLFFNNINSTLSDDIITVHVVPHSHDDPGWIWNYDQYYVGNTTLPGKCARCIFNAVFESLLTQETRTFTCSDITYFERWYKEITESQRNQVRYLIRTGRYNFAGGGWVMQDEATSFYKDIIDNMRVGIQFLKKEFDVEVETGWFLDTFGHSAANVK